MNYESTWKKLRELTLLKNTASHTFVDRIITVSTSALAFSLTFRSSILGSNPTSVWLLKTAWICLALSSITGVFLHLAPVSAADNLIRRMEQNVRAGGDGDEASASPHGIYEWYHRIMVLTFPAGLAALMAFGICNTP